MTLLTWGEPESVDVVNPSILTTFLVLQTGSVKRPPSILLQYFTLNIFPPKTILHFSSVKFLRPFFSPPKRIRTIQFLRITSVKMPLSNKVRQIPSVKSPSFRLPPSKCLSQTRSVRLSDCLLDPIPSVRLLSLSNPLRQIASFKSPVKFPPTDISLTCFCLIGNI